MDWRWQRQLVSSGGRWDAASVGFAVALGGLWLGSLVGAVAPEWWLQRSHGLQGEPIRVASQPIPAIYTGRHTWRVDREGEADPGMQEACDGRLEGLRMHVPLSVLSAPGERVAWHQCGLPATVTLTSERLGHRVATRWRMTRSGDALTVEALP